MLLKLQLHALAVDLSLAGHWASSTDEHVSIHETNAAFVPDTRW